MDLAFRSSHELTPKVDLSAAIPLPLPDVEETFRPERCSCSQPTPRLRYGIPLFNIGAGNALPELQGVLRSVYRVRTTNDLRYPYPRTPWVPGAPRVNTDRNDQRDFGSGPAKISVTPLTPKLSASLICPLRFRRGGQWSTEVTSGRLSAAYSISPHGPPPLSFGYTYREYTDGDREDDQYTAPIRLNLLA